jgi:hypothetical protein
MAKKIHLKLDYAVLYQDRTILVKTPKRYTVTAYKDYYNNDKDDIYKLEDITYKLNNSVKFLRDCLRVLGISMTRAKTHDFTLNTITGERLWDMAINSRTLSHEFKTQIFKYDW